MLPLAEHCKKIPGRHLPHAHLHFCEVTSAAQLLLHCKRSITHLLGKIQMHLAVKGASGWCESVGYLSPLMLTRGWL